jgi:DNA-binding GntR family transcriptional regulator
MTSALPSTKTEFVYQTIRKEILDGHLQPGQRLRLSELAARYEISEMPVREALRKLQHDGLVQFENHRGATVSDLGLDRIVEIIATRTYLEVYAMCEATRFHTAVTIAQLEGLVQKMKKTRNPGQYSELNRRFHKLLTEPCPNAFLKLEIDNLWDKVWRTRSQSLFQLVPARVPDATVEHEQILDAVRRRSSGDVHKTAMLHRQHTLENWQALAGNQRVEPGTLKPESARAVRPTTPREGETVG